MKDAESTAQKLRAEVEQRRQEFENLQNVDVKINDEIEATRRQMKEWEAELPSFMDVESLREEWKTKKRDRPKGELSMLKKAANAIATKYNESRSAMRSNEVQTKLHELERDIRAKATESFQIIETIEDNRRRTNYSLVKRQSMAIVQEINSLLSTQVNPQCRFESVIKKAMKLASIQFALIESLKIPKHSEMDADENRHNSDNTDQDRTHHGDSVNQCSGESPSGMSNPRLKKAAQSCAF
jgi:hypothetical protein